ncbi:hypothetical protein ACF0H5_015809 [Mactra antiquata]
MRVYHEERRILYDMAGLYKKHLPTWKELKHTQLLDERQKIEQQKWDQEFVRRQHELEKQKQASDQRRTRNSAKLSELSSRWRHLERKRVEKSEFYLERLRTNLSISLRAESMSSGSPFTDR